MKPKSLKELNKEFDEETNPELKERIMKEIMDIMFEKHNQTILKNKKNMVKGSGMSYYALEKFQ